MPELLTFPLRKVKVSASACPAALTLSFPDEPGVNEWYIPAYPADVVLLGGMSRNRLVSPRGLVSLNLSRSECLRHHRTAATHLFHPFPRSATGGWGVP